MVVLSPEPKATMDRELALALPDYRSQLRLYTRTGQVPSVSMYPDVPCSAM